MKARVMLLSVPLIWTISTPPASVSPAPRLCSSWSSAQAVGQLDEDRIGEASGLGISTAFPDRLYLINDSGDSGRFFLTASDGGETRDVAIEGFDPLDTEDVAVGACGDGTCLFIADIGDNARRREETEIVVIPESAAFSTSVVPQQRVRIRYPEGPQDAESLAVHPNGDLFLLTKTADYTRLRVEPSVVYRVPYEVWTTAGDEIVEPIRVGELNLPAISSDPFSGSLPTALDISGDGRRFLVLTYQNAFEFDIDLSAPDWKPTAEMVEGTDYREIPLTVLEQQESIAYLDSAHAFLYTTEAGGRDGVPIMRVSCAE